MAGVKAGRVHLCRVAGNTVIPYGKWRPVAQGRVLAESFILALTLTNFTMFRFFVYVAVLPSYCVDIVAKGFGWLQHIFTG